MFKFLKPVFIARIELPHPPFDYQNEDHHYLIGQRIARFKQAQSALFELDRYVAIALGIGAFCWVGAYLLPLVTLSIIGFCFATYALVHRSELFRQYKEIHDDLIETFQWSMGDKTGNHWYKLGEESIQELIETLGPWVNAETICTWQPQDLVSSNRLSFARRNELAENFKMKLIYFSQGKQTENWGFHLYGENSTDNLLQFIKAKFKNKAQVFVQEHAQEVGEFLTKVT